MVLDSYLKVLSRMKSSIALQASECTRTWGTMNRFLFVILHVGC